MATNGKWLQTQKATTGSVQRLWMQMIITVSDFSLTLGSSGVTDDNGKWIQPHLRQRWAVFSDCGHKQQQGATLASLQAAISTINNDSKQIQPCLRQQWAVFSDCRHKWRRQVNDFGLTPGNNGFDQQQVNSASLGQFGCDRQRQSLFYGWQSLIYLCSSIGSVRATEVDSRRFLS